MRNKSRIFECREKNKILQCDRHISPRMHNIPLWRLTLKTVLPALVSPLFYRKIVLASTKFPVPVLFFDRLFFKAKNLGKCYPPDHLPAQSTVSVDQKK